MCRAIKSIVPSSLLVKGQLRRIKINRSNVALMTSASIVSSCELRWSFLACICVKRMRGSVLLQSPSWFLYLFNFLSHNLLRRLFLWMVKVLRVCLAPFCPERDEQCLQDSSDRRGEERTPYTKKFGASNQCYE